MAKKKIHKPRHAQGKPEVSCCKIESIVTVDERGQMVLPKGVRDKAKIRPGDKLAVIDLEKDGEVCCITLIKADEFAAVVKEKLGPITKLIVRKNKGEGKR